ncbi:MAG: acyltransferase family protein [Bacteroidales bacterium]|nr:acyltransferase family protein [Bacteroidales bacterium]
MSNEINIKEEVKEGSVYKALGKKKRDSNLELFRILTMLLIVAHHYVVNSGLTAPDGPIFANQLSTDSIFLLLTGAWGKIGINCFVLITGYFMCKSEITSTKFLKLVLEIMFYKIVIGLIFILSDYQPFEWKSFLKLFVPFMSVKQNFGGCFILFFLFIPFLNVLIRNLDEKKHIYLLILCSLTYILFGTIHRVDMNYVSWFMVLYVISSYLRLYPKKMMTNQSFCGLMFLLTMFLSALSVLVCAWLGVKIGKNAPFFFVTDSNAFLAVLTGVFAFLFFKNMKLPYNKFINAVASTTFGVLLIHANSDTMRQWLWKDTLDNVGHYGMPLYVICCVLGVFAVCSVIDFLRIKLIETPLFYFWNKKYDCIAGHFKRKEEKIFKKIKS